VYAIGNQRVGIVIETPSGEVDELMAPVDPTESVIWKNGCSFQQAATSENQTDVVTTSGMADVVLPVDDDTRALTSASVLCYPTADDDDRYVMRGQPFLEVDMRGREQYVMCDAERQTG
jgi:hypothetical protein